MTRIALVAGLVSTVALALSTFSAEAATYRPAGHGVHSGYTTGFMPVPRYRPHFRPYFAPRYHRHHHWR